MKLPIVAALTVVLCGCTLESTAEPATSEVTTTRENVAYPIECDSQPTKVATVKTAGTPLPVRRGARIQTSGRVPHVQIGVDTVEEINQELFRLAFQLPDIDKRPTIVSLPGAIGMWLADGVPVAHPETIVSGREFAHIHSDGSLHAPLPFERALELERKGWGERHPWADTRQGWEGLVMLYSAGTEEQMKTLVQLITESYNHVTGRSVPSPVC